MSKSISAIVLAAGKGTRMKATNDKNKVAYQLNDKPMISYTIDTLKQCHINQIIVVVGYAKDSVMSVLGNDVEYAHQDQPQGTGDAVRVALPQLVSTTNQVLVMYGDDSAFYTPELIQQLITTHQANGNHLTLVSLHKDDPTGLGRIIRDDQNQMIGVVEEKVASPDQTLITEINTGLYCFNRLFLDQAIARLSKNPVSGEYYLTDVIAYAFAHGYQAEALLWNNDDIWHGINTPEQLKTAETRMKQKNAVQ
jgi:bifunctional UDP-N-acetylglucosamine pyrophosphorylase/glucosamine-1-phosphate N-acetyltransferase